MAENVWLTVATDTPAMRATSTIVATVVIVEQNVLRVNGLDSTTSSRHGPWHGRLDALESGGYDGPVHFDFKPPRTEDDDGVWESAAACMRNYLILREKVRAFRADPEVAEALRAAWVPELSLPTLSAGETWRDVRSYAADTTALGERGMAFERLDQLGLEHPYGVR